MIQTHHNTEDYECTPLISVIVPVYKVEKYIRKCLNSLQAQTYRNIEVLLVDDGSPDACGEICEAFARQDSRFRVIHQKNQGQAAARNNAVQEAAGEYIMFVDSDDFIVPECVDYLVRLLRKYNADVSVGGFYYYYEGTAVPTYRDTEKVFKMNAQEALIRMNYTQGFGAMPWAKLYKKELVLAHPFPVGVIYEDLATLYRIICDTKKVVFGTRKIYYWVQRQGSTMRMQFDERQLYGIQAVKDQYKYVKNRFPGALPSVKARYVGKIMELMAVAFHSENSRVYFVNLKKELRYVNEVLHDPR
ncbi:MAG: glycosyltransferase, partial [Ruminococcus sp.]|nr:glycosyltransferase [Ruminococcus sp.]